MIDADAERLVKIVKLVYMEVAVPRMHAGKFSRWPAGDDDVSTNR
jgi:hypothetical protein